jgi:hypothetical protein
LAQAAGIAVLRLANADVIPFAYTNLSETVKTYATELQKLRDSRAKDIAERKKQIADGLFGIVSDRMRRRRRRTSTHSRRSSISRRCSTRSRRYPRRPPNSTKPMRRGATSRR